MPQMGLEVSEAAVLAVLVAPGDEVAEGQPLLEMETDKATTELEAPRAGFVVGIEVAEGDVVAVGAVVAWIADSADERAGDGAPGGGAPAADGVADGAGATAPAPAGAGVAVANGSGATTPGLLPRAAPVARRAARALGVELTALAGTGPRGRITLGDVEAAAAAGGAATGSAALEPALAQVTPASGGELEPLTKLRRAIARRMTASQLIPQYQLQRDVDATHLLAQKDASAAGAAGGGTRPGVNDLLLQAIAEMVVRHPALATAFVDAPEPALRRHAGLGVGLAVATDRGLVVPVVEDVHQIGLGEIAARRARLVVAARDGTLSLSQMSGATITLSNLGGFGVDRFTAMLNPGESAIVAVGRATDRVVPRGRGLAVVPILTVTMTFDHRTVDGAVGGAALAELADLLEGRMTWRP
jgi:pyruvate dehydrogenase E2 component (dihydrolipoamide acetyltransferase)